MFILYGHIIVYILPVSIVSHHLISTVMSMKSVKNSAVNYFTNLK